MRTLRTTAIAAAAALAFVPVSAAHAADTPGQQKTGHYSFAVIGDVPYGPAEIAAFPGKIDRINADVDVQFTVHVGDTKNGSSPCTDEYNTFIKNEFDRFAKPWCTPRATTSGPTATVLLPAATTRSSGSRRSGRPSSPTPDSPSEPNP